MYKLTIKQNKFAELYVNNSNASESYRQAYNVKPTTSSQVTHQSACVLLKSPNVALRIKELKQELANTNYITRVDIAEGYLEIINAWKGLMVLASKEKLSKEQKQKFYLLKEMVKGSDYRGAFDSLAKMFGLNEPDKLDINQKIVNISINLND